MHRAFPGGYSGAHHHRIKMIGFTTVRVYRFQSGHSDRYRARLDCRPRPRLRNRREETRTLPNPKKENVRRKDYYVPRTRRAKLYFVLEGTGNGNTDGRPDSGAQVRLAGLSENHVSFHFSSIMEPMAPLDLYPEPDGA